MTERYSFADDVIAALNNPKRGFYMKGFSPETTQFRRQREQRVSSMRKDMRLATRYVLDDDFVDFAMEASMRADGEELVDQYKLMSPPNDLMWIEWNEVARQKTLERVCPEIGETSKVDWHNIPPSVGYLFEAAPHTGYEGEAFIGTPFANFDDLHEGLGGKVFTSPLALYFAKFDEEKGSGFSMENHRDFLADFFSLSPAKLSDEQVELTRKEEFAAVIESLGDWWCRRNLNSLPTETGHAINTLCNHLRLIQGPGVELFVNTQSGQWDSEVAKSLRSVGSDMTNGDARFLITVFAMLNYDWSVKEQKEAGSKRHYRYGKFHRGNSHIEVSIDLPKFHGVTVMPNGFGGMNESSRRQHSVRGHWRRYRKSGKRVWISSHVRGDPKLGIITKDYTLTHRR